MTHLIIITYLKFLFILYKCMRAVAQIVLVVEKKLGISLLKWNFEELLGSNFIAG